MIYLFTNDYMYIHYFYDDGYIMVYNEQYDIYKKWKFDLSDDGTTKDIAKFDISTSLPKKLILETVGDNTFRDILTKHIDKNIFNKLL